MQGGDKKLAYEKKRKIKEARLVIVAELFSKGKNYREIRSEVIRRLNLETYSLKTVHDDIESLLKEWRTQRIDNTDKAVTLFLERNRQHYQESREEWERSRQDRFRTDTKKKGVPTSGEPGTGSGGDRILTVLREEKRIQELGEGDPRYMELMIKCEEQRAKLLGLYAPERRVLTGENGSPLIPGSSNVDLNKLTPEEKAELLKMARKIE